MERQFASGGVVIKKERGEPRVLLIKDSYGHWTWAKGHIEKGESVEAAGVREISEETGITKLQVVERLGAQQYFFTLKGKRIFKTVYVLLVKASAREKLRIQRSEIEAGRWFWPEEAVKKVEYKGQDVFLKKAIRIFRKKYC
ncbi:MAG: NUDIX domain-containing protein [Candidatus Omnitrophota bacterium]